MVTGLRCWIRLYLDHRSLNLLDYLVWGGWLFTLGWVICSIVALHIQINHPLVEPDLMTDSIEYLKVCTAQKPYPRNGWQIICVQTVFISCYFFDVGLYFPKASLIAFYWWLIPHGFRRLRIAVYVSAAYMACAFIATILTDTLISKQISNNWWDALSVSVNVVQHLTNTHKLKVDWKSATFYMELIQCPCHWLVSELVHRHLVYV